MKQKLLVILLFGILCVAFILVILMDGIYEAALLAGFIGMIYSLRSLIVRYMALRKSVIVSAEIISYKERRGRYRMEYTPVVKYRDAQQQEITADYLYYDRDKQYAEGDIVRIRCLTHKPEGFCFLQKENEYMKENWETLFLSFAMCAISVWFLAEKYWN